MNRPFDLYENNKIILKNESDFLDIFTIVNGLIDVNLIL